LRKTIYAAPWVTAGGAPIPKRYSRGWQLETGYSVRLTTSYTWYIRIRAVHLLPTTLLPYWRTPFVISRTFRQSARFFLRDIKTPRTGIFGMSIFVVRCFFFCLYLARVYTFRTPERRGDLPTFVPINYYASLFHERPTRRSMTTRWYDCRTTILSAFRTFFRREFSPLITSRVTHKHVYIYVTMVETSEYFDERIVNDISIAVPSNENSGSLYLTVTVRQRLLYKTIAVRRTYLPIQ